MLLGALIVLAVGGVVAQPLTEQRDRGGGVLAAAYVLILAVAGPLVARTGDPLGRWVAARVARRKERRSRGEAERTVARATVGADGFEPPTARV